MIIQMKQKNLAAYIVAAIEKKKNIELLVAVDKSMIAKLSRTVFVDIGENCHRVTLIDSRIENGHEECGGAGDFYLESYGDKVAFAKAVAKACVGKQALPFRL